MSTAPDRAAWIREGAGTLVTLGYHLVPCEPGGKRPLVRWTDSPSNPAEIDRWLSMFGGDINLAIHAGRSGVAVLDADTPEAVAWIEAHAPATPMTARTPRGGLHAYYQADEATPPPRTGVLGLGLDVKSGPSLIVVSPSFSREHGRRWQWDGLVVRPEELPPFPSALVPCASPTPPASPTSGLAPRPPPSGPIRSVTRWIMSVESVQGQGGSNQCFRVACRLASAGLLWGEAWRWLCEWNLTRATPPWSEKELRHKLTDAYVRVGADPSGGRS